MNWPEAGHHPLSQKSTSWLRFHGRPIRNGTQVIRKCLKGSCNNNGSSDQLHRRTSPKCFRIGRARWFRLLCSKEIALIEPFTILLNFFPLIIFKWWLRHHCYSQQGNSYASSKIGCYSFDYPLLLNPFHLICRCIHNKITTIISDDDIQIIIPLECLDAIGSVWVWILLRVDVSVDELLVEVVNADLDLVTVNYDIVG